MREIGNSYFAFQVEVVPDKKGADGHAHFLVGPVDALTPPVPLGQDAEQNFAEFDALLLVLVDHVRHDVHDEAPQHVVVDDAAVRVPQDASHLPEVGHGVAHHWLVLVHLGVQEGVEILEPVDLRHLLLQLAQRQLAVDVARVVSVRLRQSGLWTEV